MVYNEYEEPKSIKENNTPYISKRLFNPIDLSGVLIIGSGDIMKKSA